MPGMRNKKSVRIRVLLQSSITYATLIHRFLVVFYWSIETIISLSSLTRAVITSSFALVSFFI